MARILLTLFERAPAVRAPTLALGLLLLVPASTAHGSIEASELEIELLSDELDEVTAMTAGYDIGQVFLGEAHVPAVGEGEAGDGLYFRASFAGRAPPGDAARITFGFDAPGGRIERTITVSGDAVTGDFDVLLAELSADTLLVERAFVSLPSAGVAPGEILSGFTVVSSAGGQVVDVAPGSRPVGPISLPVGESVVVTESALVTGPVRYLDVKADLDGDILRLLATSLLREGSQHIDLDLRANAPVEPEGQTSVSVGPNGTAEFVVRLLGDARFDVTTDVGGRTGLVVEEGSVRDERGNLLAEAREEAPTSRTPSPAWAAIAALVAVALFARPR